MGDLLHARVNHGRWIVDCPECGGAQRLEDLSKYSCPPCHAFVKPRPPVDHEHHGSPTRYACWEPECDFAGDVKVPSEKMRAQIDAVLSERPDATTRNWEPGETVADLRAENDERLVA